MKHFISFALVVTFATFAAGAFAADAVTVTDWIVRVLDLGTSIIGAAAVITSLTPSKKDDAIVNAIKTVLDVFAFRFGFAKSDYPTKQ